MKTDSYASASLLAGPLAEIVSLQQTARGGRPRGVDRVEELSHAMDTTGRADGRVAERSSATQARGST